MEILKKIWIKAVKLCGWKLILPEKGSRPELERCIFVVAPHTSAWDFIIGATYLWSCCSNGKVFIKKEFFRWPLGGFLRSLGGISIDREGPNAIVLTAVYELKKNKSLSIAITPEGSRKARKNWKRGFWWIAREADVPIVPTYIDFSKKEIGLFDTIWPTDDCDADLLKVRKLYKKEFARFPSQFVEVGNFKESTQECSGYSFIYVIE